MNKKAWCTYKLIVLLNIPIQLLFWRSCCRRRRHCKNSLMCYRSCAVWCMTLPYSKIVRVFKTLHSKERLGKKYVFRPGVTVHWVSVNGKPKRRKKSPFSNNKGFVLTVTKFPWLKSSFWRPLSKLPVYRERRKYPWNYETV